MGNGNHEECAETVQLVRETVTLQVTRGRVDTGDSGSIIL